MAMVMQLNGKDILWCASQQKPLHSYKIKTTVVTILKQLKHMVLNDRNRIIKVRRKDEDQHERT